jgi:prephenate dehydratase
MSKVACLGPEGTYTELAAKRMHPKARLVYMDDVGDVFKFVEEGKGEGVAAIENSLEGSIGRTLESLMTYDLRITGELTLDISLSIMARKGVKPNGVKVIMSHSNPLGQCREYLARHYPKARKEAVSSTAEAMKSAARLKNAAAVGMKETGLKQGLVLLAENVQDMESQTRFVSISNKEVGGGKTSLIFAVNDEPGALYSILKIFADNNINLTKIESRPSRRKLGEYVFFLDYENAGRKTDERRTLHAMIRDRTTYFKYLGSY